MRVFHSPDNLPYFTSPVVTVGSFDGLHRGHRVLLERVRKIAGEAGESVVVTFSPHPRQVLARGGDVKLLNTLPEKIFLLGEAGIDNLVIVPFTEVFANTSYSDFVSDVLVGGIGMKSLVTGYDHRFGRDKEGDYSSLREMSSRLGFAVEQIPRQLAGEHKVSSTEVRRAVDAGDMRLAAELMSRGYIMIADIDGRGMVTVHDEIKLVPPSGCYDVTVGRGPEACGGTLVTNGSPEAFGDILTIGPGRAMRLENRQGREPERDVIITF